MPPLHAASGVGYGTSRVAQQHRHVPDGWMRAAKYFLEDLGVDINTRDADGFTALHHAAARGDNETIQYLVEVVAPTSWPSTARADDRGHGEQSRAADAAVPCNDQAARKHGREEQSQLPRMQVRRVAPDATRPQAASVARG